jgi:hypothetical protein
VKRELERLNMYNKVPRTVEDLINTQDKITLNYMEDYVRYHLGKYVENTDDFNTDYQKPQFKKPQKFNFAREAIRQRLHEFADIAGISPDQLAENIENETALVKPSPVEYNPESVANGYIDPLSTLCHDLLPLLQNLCT